MQQRDNLADRIWLVTELPQFKLIPPMLARSMATTLK
jgi:hypothetical protein